ncbi:MAG: HAD-IIIA family hydrolase [Heliobacteriaceae bacterium]|jgi:3-deoxy-D-manno-octulosonate 8-phosphate phosphatase (KDO 8-P phosphatase)|nr:HAD-IIIA family hydrolase [Heliobacteriaceae bacterium]
MKIKLAAFDIDGVMTDGSLTFDENGVEYKTYNAKDGQGIINLNNAGYITAIITARSNGTVAHRAKILNITELYQGQKSKLDALDELTKKYNLSYEEIAYMGDDLPDICVLEKVGLPACPADAVEEVKKAARFVSSKDGGKGAVREFCDMILDTGRISENKKDI